MNEAFIETLRSWQNFYFMTGGAAAGLVGLMFVALSLGMHLVNEQTREDMKIFVTPSIIYFVSTLLISCVMLAPTYTLLTLGVILLAGGMAGMVRVLPTVRKLTAAANHHGDFNIWDWLFQIILPVANYILLITSAGGFLLGQWELGFSGLWITSILLLITGIANTWSLVIWIIEKREA